MDKPLQAQHIKSPGIVVTYGFLNPNWTLLGGDVAVPNPFWVDANFAEIPCLVQLRVVVDKGRLVCDALECQRRTDGPILTTEGLRKIPVKRLIREGAFRVVGRGAEKIKDQILVSQTFSWLPTDIAKHGPTDDAMGAVAMIYRVAHALGDPPTTAVAEVLSLSRSTAGRWVTTARRKGFLGETTKGKAGEER